MEHHNFIISTNAREFKEYPTSRQVFLAVEHPEVEDALRVYRGRNRNNEGEERFATPHWLAVYTYVLPDTDKARVSVKSIPLHDTDILDGHRDDIYERNHQIYETWLTNILGDMQERGFISVTEAPLKPVETDGYGSEEIFTGTARALFSRGAIDFYPKEMAFHIDISLPQPDREEILRLQREVFAEVLFRFQEAMTDPNQKQEMEAHINEIIASLEAIQKVDPSSLSNARERHQYRAQQQHPKF